MRQHLSAALLSASLAVNAQAADGRFLPGEQACFARTYSDAHLASHPRQTVREIQVFRAPVQVQGDEEAPDGGSPQLTQFLGEQGLPARRANWVGVSVRFRDKAQWFYGAGLCTEAPSGRYVCVNGACDNHWALTLDLRSRDRLVLRPGMTDDAPGAFDSFRVAACGSGSRTGALERDIPTVEEPHSVAAPSDDLQFNLVRTKLTECTVPKRWQRTSKAD